MQTSLQLSDHSSTPDASSFSFFKIFLSSTAVLCYYFSWTLCFNSKVKFYLEHKRRKKWSSNSKCTCSNQHCTCACQVLFPLSPKWVYGVCNCKLNLSNLNDFFKICIKPVGGNEKKKKTTNKKETLATLKLPADSQNETLSFFQTNMLCLLNSRQDISS